MLAALLDAHGADLFGAAGGQLGLSDANFTRVARIETCLDLRARLAHARVVDRIAVAAAGT